MPNPADTRLRVLNAAAAIVAREGAGHLTIDAVAAESGFSKGGVLYHYPTKQALLRGMLEKLLHEVESRAARARNESQPSQLCAWILAEQEQSDDERATSLALLANAAEDPSLLTPASGLVEQTFKGVANEAADKDLARILLLATEGLRFLSMLNLLPFNERERKRLHVRLLSLAGEAS
jgi:AcrR family transcriptional regulator